MFSFGKIFAKQCSESLLQKAEQLISQARFGEAKLLLEKALRANKQGSVQLNETIRGTIQNCATAIGKQRLTEANRLIEQGDVDLAVEELHAMQEIRPTPENINEAQLLLESLEKQAAVASVVGAPPSVHEQVQIMQSAWDDAQQAEYNGYGSDFEEGLRAFHEERFSDALSYFEALAKDAEHPVYLLFELGRLRLLNEQDNEAKEAFRLFLQRLPQSSGQETRLSAHMELARIANDANDFEGVVEELQNAMDALHDDPRPYMALAAFLRDKEHHLEAIEILETVLEMMDDVQPNVQVWIELGMNLAAMGKKEEAIANFERMVEELIARGHIDLPPGSTSQLAELLEEQGNLQRAADLYRLLSEGSDTKNHGRYYAKLGQLLHELNANAEAQKALQRATALLGEESELGLQCHELLGKLRAQ
ncbi:MAG: hypothetical protein IPJ88_09250 [Myxococcales bacterium]|nr:MAG: hypothetical protein IPJ88_09250 [Myxococcales bacterium]